MTMRTRRVEKSPSWTIVLKDPLTLRQLGILLYGASKALAKKYSYHTHSVSDFIDALKAAEYE